MISPSELSQLTKVSFLRVVGRKWAPVTKRQEKIRDGVLAQKRPFTVPSIVFQLRQKATNVYNTLALMEQAGEVRRVGTRMGEGTTPRVLWEVVRE